MNFDDVVNIFDVNLVTSHWGETAPAGDANHDGAVNIFDVNLISSNWSTGNSGAAAVPEPSGFVLSVLIGVALLGRAAKDS